MKMLSDKDLYPNNMDKCLREFDSNLTLRRNSKLNQEQLQLPYRCTKCQFRSTTHRQLIEHFDLVIFQLDVFSPFSFFRSLQIHQLIVCQFCLHQFDLYRWANIRFPNPEQIENEMENVLKHFKKHLNVDQDLVSCTKCKQTFLHQNQLDYHLQADHNPYEFKVKGMCLGEFL